MKVYLIKTLSGLLGGDQPSIDWYVKLKIGDGVHGDFKKIRNIKFHRKYFALLNVGFDNWEPGEINSKYGKPEKNFTRFREDIAIMCGYFDLVIRLDGTSRPEARSISFAKMEAEDFADLYSKTIDLLIKHVYKKQDMDPEKLNRIVESYLQFG